MQKEFGFPWWLVCLVLFAALVTVCFLIIPDGRPEAVAVPGLAAGSEGAFVVADADGAGGTPNDADAEPTAAVPAESDTAAPGEAQPTDALPIEPEATPVPIADPVTANESASALPVAAVHVHRFVNGVCAECGATPEFFTVGLPAELVGESEFPGTVVTHDYTVTAYANHGEGQYSKTLQVYLPYGYDPATPYNVLFLLPGQNDHVEAWLTEEHNCGGAVLTGKGLLDKMFETGRARPFIVVSVVAETAATVGVTSGVYQIRDEFRNDLLPWVVDNYSTYASDSSLESITAAREHFALGGLSDGALILFEAGMRYDFDLFGNYMALSGNGEPWITVANLQSDERFKDLPVTCFFTGAGALNDWQQGYTADGFKYFVDNDPRFRENENAFHVDVQGGHEWLVWLVSLCNAAPVLFQ